MKTKDVDRWSPTWTESKRLRSANIEQAMKPSTQKYEITLSQALVVGREGYVDCPFCPARLHCSNNETVECADVARDCFKIVTKELERLQTVPDIDKCPSCVGMRESVERYKNMAQMAIDNLIGE